MTGGHNGYTVYAHTNKNSNKDSKTLSREYKALTDVEKRAYEALAEEENNRPLTPEKIDARTIAMNQRIESLLCEAHDMGISSSITLRFGLSRERNGTRYMEQMTSFCTILLFKIINSCHRCA